MGLNHKSQRIQTWRDQLHCETPQYAPGFAKSLKLLTYILSEVWSPRYVQWVKNELGKIVAAHPDLDESQLKAYSALQEKIARRFILIDERTAKKAERKAKKKEAAKAKEAMTPAAPTGGSRWARLTQT